MKEKLQQISAEALEALSQVTDLKVLDEMRVKFLGKKGELTQILKGMGSLSAEERPILGQMANEVRAKIEAKLEETKTALAAKEQELKLKAEVIDVTMPGHTCKCGHKHPLTKTVDEIKDIFKLLVEFTTFLFINKIPEKNRRAISGRNRGNQNHPRMCCSGVFLLVL